MARLATIRPEIRPFSQAIRDGIASRIRRALSHSRYREFKAIEVETLEPGQGTESDEPAIHVRLRGNVSSFYMKQMAQELTRKVAPDVGIRNDLLVVPETVSSLFLVDNPGDSKPPMHFRPKG